MRCRIEPAGPGTVHACGLVIPPGGIERDLDAATLGLLSGDACVTVSPVEEPATPEGPAAPEKTRGKNR
ncbi:MAG: hypothetical protein OXK73_12255 [Rhodospirillaceae bacterium]|nr:hypothetical protein [Rhodospirillaceae bacterium]